MFIVNLIFLTKNYFYILMGKLTKSIIIQLNRKILVNLC